jgi:formimidoylglutamate deiminase
MEILDMSIHIRGTVGSASMAKLLFDQARLAEGWRRDVLIEVDKGGRIAHVTPGAIDAPARRIAGACVPGVPNLHSHAFQRAMAGLAEIAGPGADSFWTWRQVMYHFLARLTPEDVEAMAAQLYVEMLKAGYTAVAEFHYLHNGSDGRPYSEPTILSDRIVAAATDTGIGLTLLPVLYAQSGFGGQPPTSGQRRFIHDADSFMALVEALAKKYRDTPDLVLGIAPHSLRAVGPAMLADVLNATERVLPGCPIHIHVAEQVLEVEDCLAATGRRPVDLLFDLAPVGPRWCLVHATHMSDAELAAVAGSGAVAGLCPSTEGNLGDGIFPAAEYLRAKGRFGIGSDSHISISVAEELRLLEYYQRLKSRARNVLAGGAGTSTGATLLDHAVAGGAQALGRDTGALAVGKKADFVVLDTGSPTLAGRTGDQILDAWIFVGGANPVSDVFVSGRHVIKRGRHKDEAAIAERFTRTMSRLLAS